MHSQQEYHELLKRVWCLANQMAGCAAEKNSSGPEVIRFLKQYAYEEYPSDKVGETFIGPWLFEPTRPYDPSKSISIILCFSDDEEPDILDQAYKQEKRPIAYFNESKDEDGNEIYSIVLYDADKWSCAELALRLLHEGRHARHKLALRFGLKPLDDKDRLHHEVNCWLLELDILNTWGGKLWDTAVQRAVRWLEEHRPQTGSEIDLCYYPELDQLFGTTQDKIIRDNRSCEVFLSACIKYAVKMLAASHPDKVAYDMISKWYSEGTLN